MIDSIERNGTRVILNIDIGFKIEKPILPFSWECGKEYIAELLKDHLLDQLDKFKKEIASKPHFYLEQEEISKLKSMLVREWNGTKHCWK